MVHWICPECGLECAPSNRDCPSCYPSRDPAAVVSGGDAQAEVGSPQSHPAVLGASTEQAELSATEGATELAGILQPDSNGLAHPLLTLAGQLEESLTLCNEIPAALDPVAPVAVEMTETAQARVSTAEATEPGPVAKVYEEVPQIPGVGEAEPPAEPLGAPEPMAPPEFPQDTPLEAAPAADGVAPAEPAQAPEIADQASHTPVPVEAQPAREAAEAPESEPPVEVIEEGRHASVAEHVTAADEPSVRAVQEEASHAVPSVPIQPASEVAVHEPVAPREVQRESLIEVSQTETPAALPVEAKPEPPTEGQEEVSQPLSAVEAEPAIQVAELSDAGIGAEVQQEASAEPATTAEAVEPRQSDPPVAPVEEPSHPVASLEPPLTEVIEVSRPLAQVEVPVPPPTETVDVAQPVTQAEIQKKTLVEAAEPGLPAATEASHPPELAPATPELLPTALLLPQSSAPGNMERLARPPYSGKAVRRPEPKLARAGSTALVPVRVQPLDEGAIVTVLGDRPKTPKAPGWLVSLLVALVMLIAGVALLFYLTPGETKPARSSAPEPADPRVNVVSAASAHPLTKYLEVTGLRVNFDLNRESSIQYIVVNHSSAQIGDAMLSVVVRAANGRPQQPPVCAFRLRIPSLGPYESREFTNTIETQMRSIEMPDWPSLRADIEVTAP